MKPLTFQIGKFEAKIMLYSNLTLFEKQFIYGLCLYGERLDSACRFQQFFDHLLRNTPNRPRKAYGGHEGFIRERFYMGLDRRDRLIHTVDLSRPDVDLPEVGYLVSECQLMKNKELTNSLKNYLVEL